MHTFGELLAAFLDDRKIPMDKLTTRDVRLLAKVVAETVKEAGLTVCRLEKLEPQTVNNYPLEARAVIEAVFTRYFDNPGVFRHTNGSGRKFNYDVPHDEVAAFEAACKFVGIACERNNVTSEKVAQFLVPRDNPYLLIKLGKAFHIQRASARKAIRANHNSKHYEQ